MHTNTVFRQFLPGLWLSVQLVMTPSTGLAQTSNNGEEDALVADTVSSPDSGLDDWSSRPPEEYSLAKMEVGALSDLSLEELLNVVIVSADRTEQKASDVPASVVVVTRQEIERYGYTSLTEILASILGVYLVDDYGFGGIRLGVRGFYQDWNRTVMIRINGVDQRMDALDSYSLDSLEVPVESIDHIEIVRGPMAVLYGSGALFGVINIITDPRDEDHHQADLSASYGTLNSAGVNAYISHRRGEFQFTAFGIYNKSDGPAYPLAKMMSNPVTLYGYGLTENSTTENMLESSNRLFGLSAAYGGAYCKITASQQESEAYFVIPPLDEGTVANYLGYNVALGYRHETAESFKWEGMLTYRGGNINYDLPILYEGAHNGGHYFSGTAKLELHSEIRPMTGLKLIAGLDHTRVLTAENWRYYPSLADIDPEGHVQTVYRLASGSDIETYGAFVQGSYDILQGLQAVVGLRVEKQLPYTLRERDFVPLGQPAAQRDIRIRNDDLAVLPRVALLYHITEANVVKLLYGESTNRPGFFQVVDDIQWNGRFLPERSRVVEVNYSGTPVSELMINFSLYRNYLEDVTVSRNVKSGGRSVVRNVSEGQLLTDGVELRAMTSPWEGLRFDVGVALQKMEDHTEDAKPVAYSPELLGNARLSYRLPLPLGITVAVMGRYTGSMRTLWDVTPSDPNDPDSEPLGRIGKKAPAYFVLDANLRADDIYEGLYVSLHANNLLDEIIRYPTTTQNPYFDRGTLGPRRMLYATVGWSFD